MPAFLRFLMENLGLSRAKIAVGHLGHRNNVDLSQDGSTIVVTPRGIISRETVEHIVATLKGDGIEARAGGNGAAAAEKTE